MSKEIKSTKFNSDGKLKVMHVTDTHLDVDNIDMSVYLIEQACRRESPDIAVVTGDNVQNCDNAEKTKGFIDKLMNAFQKTGVPVAITFGNHDSECGSMSREELTDYYKTYSCCVDVNDESAPDCGTYNIPVLSSDNSQVKFSLWVFDSNDYDSEGHYGCVLENQVDWYKEKSDEITNKNGGEKVYSLAFQHIIVPEVYNALKKADKKRLYSFSHMYNKKDFYMFDDKTVNFGTLNETPCCGYNNYGQFDAMVEKGDVLAIFSGHDHTNAFGVKYKGIDIVNSLSTRFNGDRFSSQYGYRIIEVDEKNTSVYTSRVERWYNMFSFKDISSIKSSGDTFAYKTALSVKLKGYIQKFYTKTGRWFTTLTTGKIGRATSELSHA